MGVARGAIALLAEETARRPFAGKLATLGRQRIHASSAEATRQLERFGIVPRQVLRDPLDDVALFEALGFDTVQSYDYSDYEGATYLLDLNSGVVPDSAVGQYDVVFDSGTIEHVFHVPNSLKAIVDMTKVGGRIILLSPSSNHLDHGFYMFSPTLFCDFFAANKLEVEKRAISCVTRPIRRLHGASINTVLASGTPCRSAASMGGPTSISWLQERPLTQPTAKFRSRASTPRRQPNTAVRALPIPLRNPTPMRVVRRDGGRPRAECWSVYPVH